MWACARPCVGVGGIRWVLAGRKRRPRDLVTSNLRSLRENKEKCWIKTDYGEGDGRGASGSRWAKTGQQWWGRVKAWKWSHWLQIVWPEAGGVSLNWASLASTSRPINIHVATCNSHASIRWPPVPPLLHPLIVLTNPAQINSWGARSVLLCSHPGH